MKHRRTIEQLTIKNEKDVYHAVNQSALRTLWSNQGTSPYYSYQYSYTLWVRKSKVKDQCFKSHCTAMQIYHSSTAL